MTRFWFLTLVIPSALWAQSTREARAERLITESDVRRHILLIADDSMRGRDTPSPELDQTAAFLSGEFQRFGLHTTIQRYPLAQRQLTPGRSSVTFSSSTGPKVTLTFTHDAAFIQGTVSEAPRTAPLVVLGGSIDGDKIAADSLKDRTVLWLADFSEAGLAKMDGIAGAILAAHPAIILVVPSDTSAMAGPRMGQTQSRLSFEGAGGLSFTLAMLYEPAITAQAPTLGQEFSRIRKDPGTVARSLRDYSATLTMADSIVSTVLAPNLVGILPGTDPALRNEYVVFSAHMDHLGMAHGESDSVFNGADDNGSGTVGVLELAHALSQKGLTHRRSLMFLIASGEEKGLWGSAYFTEHPPVPIDSIVADVNMDMIGRNWRDTVGVIGREYSNLGDILDRVAERHRGLHVTPVEDRWPDQRRFFRSDHYNFARKGVPIIFLSSGYSPDYHLVSDSPNKIDAEKEARLLRLIFHFGLELANRSERPRWDPASYRKIVETGKP